MNSKTILILICLGLALLLTWGYFSKGGSAASVQGVSVSNSESGALKATETFHDFGTISMKNGNVSRDFTIENPTSSDITLSRVITSCMCTTAYIQRPDGSSKGPFGMPGHGGAVPPANELIKAGESRTIRVVFNPNAHGPAGVGPIDRFITLSDSSGKNLQLEIKANVTP